MLVTSFAAPRDVRREFPEGKTPVVPPAVGHLARKQAQGFLDLIGPRCLEQRLRLALSADEGIIVSHGDLQGTG